MSTTHDTPTAPAAGAKRIKPYQISIAFGVGIGVFTMISGIVPQITGWEEESLVHRKVFEGIPGALQIAFYTVIPMLLIWGSLRFADRIRNWERGAPDRRKTTRKNFKQRLADYRAGVYMRTLLRDSAAGLMHSMMYFGFLILLGVTTVLEIDHQLPPALKFLHGDVYKGYAAVGDFAGLMFTGGVVWAIVRRYVQQPYRIRIKTKPEHALILATLLAIGVSGFGAEMFRIAKGQAAGVDLDFEKWSFVGYFIADILPIENGVLFHRTSWILHVISFFVFLISLPQSKLRHIITSPVNMFLSPKDRPKGAMKDIGNLLEAEDIDTVGVEVIENFSWKQLVDLDACTVCGRCTSVCPANLTGKPLDPREIILKVGQVMSESGSPAVPATVTTPIDLQVKTSNVFERITPEEIWDCTS